MLSLNISLVYVIINLLIFYFLMKKFLFGPVHRILDERQKLIAEEMAQAKSLKEAAQQEKEQYEASMHDAKTEAENVLRKAKEDADAAYARTMQTAQEESARVKEEARKAAAREKEQVLREARTQIAGLAADTASQILGQCTGVKTDEQIYEQFLKKAGEEQ